MPLVPSQEFWRYYHAPPSPQEAEVSWQAVEGDGSRRTLQITYEKPLKRVLSITQEKTFPFAVTGWTETIHRGGRTSQTTATLKKRGQMAYWEKNTLRHTPLRREYGLE